MKCNKENLTLYAITDSRFATSKSLAELVEDAILGGATMIQYREKTLTGDALISDARAIFEVCKAHNTPFIINDYVWLAIELDADGVHVGQSDLEVKEARNLLGPDKIIGVTAKTVEQAIKAEQNGASYLGSGAVFGTTTKLDAKPMSMELLKEITTSVSIPVVAIGGITTGNIHKLEGSGIAGVAVVSGLLRLRLYVTLIVTVSHAFFIGKFL